MNELQKIQKDILNQVVEKIDSQKIYTWIHNDEFLVCDFLLQDYFIAVVYGMKSNNFSLTIRNKSKIGRPSVFDELISYIQNKFTDYNYVEKERLLQFNYKYQSVKNLVNLYSNLVIEFYNYFAQYAKLTPIFNSDDMMQSKEEFELILANKELQYIGIYNQTGQFFLAYAKNNGQSDIVYALQKKGFIAVEHKVGVTVFRRMNKDNYGELLAYFPKSFSELNNVLYTVEKPKNPENNNNLIILFSYSNKSNENLVDRYYIHSHPFLAMTAPKNTYIVRICDLGDSFGSHGLNTQFDSNIEANIQNFIKNIADLYNISKENILIMGASSGGTGALYHGLKGGYKTLAIDPFLGNMDYYNGRDPLYLKTLEPSIQDVFTKLPLELFNSMVSSNENFESVIITSVNSQFYKEIIKFKKAYAQSSLVVYNTDKITKHPDVAKVTASLCYEFINDLLADKKVGNQFLQADYEDTSHLIIDNTYIELKDIYQKNNKLFIDGIAFIENCNASENSDISYNLIFKSANNTITKRLAKSHKPSITAQFATNYNTCYDKCWFTTFGYKGLDLADIPEGEYELFLSIECNGIKKIQKLRTTENVTINRQFHTSTDTVNKILYLDKIIVAENVSNINNPYDR